MTMSQTELTAISGVGESTAGALWRAGFQRISDLANASIEDIAAVPGFGYVRAQQVRAEAREMCEDDVAPAIGGVVTLGDAATDLAAKESKGKKKKKSKDKKDKKDKKESKKSDKKGCGKDNKKKDKKKGKKKGKKDKKK